jgi:hypothetical protein
MTAFSVAVESNSSMENEKNDFIQIFQLVFGFVSSLDQMMCIRQLVLLCGGGGLGCDDSSPVNPGYNPSDLPPRGGGGAIDHS